MNDLIEQLADKEATRLCASMGEKFLSTYGVRATADTLKDKPITAYVTEIQDNYAARYNALCTAFHESQRLYCEEITRQQAANLRKKRQLRGLRDGRRLQRIGSKLLFGVSP